MSKQVYEFEVNADAVFIDALNNSLAKILDDETSDWSFHHVKLNAQKMFLSTWDETGQYLKNLLEVSRKHPRSVVISNMKSRAVDFRGETLGTYGMTSLIVEGRVVSEDFISSKNEEYRFGSHQHSFVKNSGHHIPAELCVESHYGYLFHFNDDTGRQFVFSRKLNPGETWSDYKGIDQLLDYAPGFELNRLSAKAFMCFADSEAELILLETRERARIGTFSLHPVCHNLNIDALHQIFPTDEGYELAEKGYGLHWSVMEFFKKLPQKKWDKLVVSLSDLLAHERVKNGD